MNAPTAAPGTAAKTAFKELVFSGMQPSGELHIGNYLGALKQWAALVEGPARSSAIFCIVDAHAVTVEYDAKEMRQRIIDAATTYIAGGIDPEKATMFVQSDVPHHMGARVVPGLLPRRWAISTA